MDIFPNGPGAFVIYMFPLESLWDSLKGPGAASKAAVAVSFCGQLYHLHFCNPMAQEPPQFTAGDCKWSGCSSNKKPPKCCFQQSIRSLFMHIFQYSMETHNLVFAHPQVGWTAMIGAAQNGHKAVVQMLISNGADVNHQSKVCIPLIVSNSNRLWSGWHLAQNENPCTTLGGAGLDSLTDSVFINEVLSYVVMQHWMWSCVSQCDMVMNGCRSNMMEFCGITKENCHSGSSWQW